MNKILTANFFLFSKRSMRFSCNDFLTVDKTLSSYWQIKAIIYIYIYIYIYILFVLSGDSWKLAFVKESTVLGVEVSWIGTLLLLLLWLRLLLLLFPLMMSSTLYYYNKVKIIVEMVTMAAETNKNGSNTKCSLEVAALWFLNNSCL